MGGGLERQRGGGGGGGGGQEEGVGCLCTQARASLLTCGTC